MKKEIGKIFIDLGKIVFGVGFLSVLIEGNYIFTFFFAFGFLTLFLLGLLLLNSKK